MLIYNWSAGRTLPVTSPKPILIPSFSHEPVKIANNIELVSYHQIDIIIYVDLYKYWTLSLNIRIKSAFKMIPRKSVGKVIQ